jgi:hypothetical protein
MLTDPAYDDTDNLAVSKLINAMKQIRGSRFPDEAEIAQHFGKERLRYTFHFRDGSPSTWISVGGTVPDSLDPVMLYVRQDFGPVTTIPIQFVHILTTPNPFRFRSRDLLTFEARTATGIWIRLEGRTYSVEQQNGVWIVMEPANHTVENVGDIETLLRKLGSAYAAGVVEPLPASDVMGLAEPFLEAVVTYSTPEGVRTAGPLRLGNLTASKSRFRFGRVSGRLETFYVDHGLIEDLRIGLQGIRPIEE